MFTAGDLNNDGMLDFYEVDDGQDYVNYITGMQPDVNVTINQTNNIGSGVSTRPQAAQVGRDIANHTVTAIPMRGQ